MQSGEKVAPRPLHKKEQQIAKHISRGIPPKTNSNISLVENTSTQKVGIFMVNHHNHNNATGRNKKTARSANEDHNMDNKDHDKTQDKDHNRGCDMDHRRDHNKTHKKGPHTRTTTITSAISPS